MISIEWRVEYRNFGRDEIIRGVTASVKFDGDLPDGDVVTTEAPEQYKDLVKEIIDNSKTALKLLSNEKERTTYLSIEGSGTALGLKSRKIWKNYFCKQEYYFFEYYQTWYSDFGYDVILFNGVLDNGRVETFVTKIL